MFIVTAMVEAAGQSLVLAVEEHRAFENKMEGLPPERARQLREERQARFSRATEERRHRELVEATRSRDHSPLGFILGLIVGRSF